MPHPQLFPRSLTPREQEILALFGQHYSDREIADQLTLAVSTVKWYARQIYAKLGVDNRRAAVRCAEGLGVLGTTRLGAHRAPPLPTPLVPFVGRDRELAALSSLLHDPRHRLITLLGPGGVGKTALAVELARRNMGIFADGVYFVPLAPLHAAADLDVSIAQALDVQLRRTDAPHEQLLHYVRTKSLLLVLDNFEHLVAGAGYVADLLHAAPYVHVLGTSREALDLVGETRFPVAGLGVAADGSGDKLHDNSAVTLFMQSVHRAVPTFVPTADDVSAITAICQRVEGMPLAILLAGAWMPVLSASEILHELSQTYHFLATHSRDVPARQRSMEAVFASTWERLTLDERAVVAHVSVFRGGFTRAAAEHVAGASLLVLKGLIDKSLLHHYVQTQRYDMHELLRQYADEQLGVHRDEVNQRHAVYYTTFAEQADQALIGWEQPRWLQRLADDHDNFRAAFRWLLERHEVELALRLSAALRGLWFIRSHIVEGKMWLEAVLTQSDRVIHDGTVTPTHLAARASAVSAFGYTLFNSYQRTAAFAQFEHAYALYQALGNERGQVDARISMGFASRFLPDSQHVVPYLEESFARARTINYPRGMYRALHFLAGWYLDHHDLARAEALIGQSLPLAREQGDLWAQGFMLVDLARMKFVQGEYAGARTLYVETLRTQAQLRHNLAIQDSLVGLACVAVVTDTPTAYAATLFGAAEALCERMGIALDIAAIMHDEHYAAYVGERRRTDAAFATAWATGRAMSMEQAMTFASGDTTA